MILSMSECIGNSELLCDLSRYKSVDKYIEGMVREETSFRPLDFLVKVGNKECGFSVYSVVECGKIADNVSVIIDKIRRLYHNYRVIPNDTMEIQADIFERELVINLILP